MVELTGELGPWVRSLRCSWPSFQQYIGGKGATRMPLQKSRVRQTVFRPEPSKGITPTTSILVPNRHCGFGNTIRNPKATSISNRSSNNMGNKAQKKKQRNSATNVQFRYSQEVTSYAERLLLSGGRHSLLIGDWSRVQLCNLDKIEFERLVCNHANRQGSASYNALPRTTRYSNAGSNVVMSGSQHSLLSTSVSSISGGCIAPEGVPEMKRLSVLREEANESPRIEDQESRCNNPQDIKASPLCTKDM